MKFWKKKNASKAEETSKNREYIAEALEPRILYSGAPVDAGMPDEAPQEVREGDDAQQHFDSIEDIGSQSLPPIDVEAGNEASESVILTNFDNLSPGEIENLAKIAVESWNGEDLDEKQAEIVRAIEVSLVDIAALAEPTGFDYEFGIGDDGFFVADDFDFGESYSVDALTARQSGLELISDLLTEIGDPIYLEDLAASQIAQRTVDVQSDTVTTSTLEAISEAAEQAWIRSGLNADQLAALESIEFHIVDLDGRGLGYAEGSHIYIDDDAAGRGWYQDLTPYDNLEFVENEDGILVAVDSGAANQIDLLSVVTHEVGHVLGLADEYGAEHQDDLMYGGFTEGVRRLPADGQAAGAVAGGLEGRSHGSVTITDFADVVNGGPVDSLREAINQAGDGDVITLGSGTFLMELDDGGVLSVNGSIDNGTNENNNVSGDFDINNKDITIAGAGKDQTFIDAQQLDRVFHILGGSNVTFRDLTIQGGAINYSHGGGFYVESGSTVNLVNVAISENLVQTEDVTNNDRHGGGFWANQDATVIGTNVDITGNVAQKFGAGRNSVGGGFWLSNGADVTLTDSVIDGNTAIEGGGFYLSVDSIPSDAVGSVVTLNNTDITDNTGVNRGGGFRNAGIGENGTVIINSGTISGNVAENEHGGGFYNSGTVNLTDVIIDSNQTLDSDKISGSDKKRDDGYGGGFLNNAGGVVTIDGASRITNNSAFGHGGGFWNREGTTTITGTAATNVLISGNIVYRDGEDTDGDNRGGGGFINSDAGTVNLEFVEITANETKWSDLRADETGFGAGFYNTGQSTVNLTDVWIHHQSETEQGGGFYQDGVQSKIYGTRVTIEDNEAAVRGGGFRNATFGALVSLTDSVIRRNIADEEHGGGFYNNGEIDFSNVSITDNHTFDNPGSSQAIEFGTVVASIDGHGAGFYNSGGNVTIRDGSLIDSNSAFGHGGGFFNSGGVVTVMDSIISNNYLENDPDLLNSSHWRVDRHGGGFGNFGDGTVNLTGVSLADNRTRFDSDGNLQSYGGGFYNADGSTVNIDGASEIVRNQAEDGGGFYNTSTGSTVNISGTLATAVVIGGSAADANSARVRGGAFRSAGGTSVNLEYVTIDSNTAGSERGGGFYADGAQITGSYVTLSNNQTLATTGNRQGGGGWASSFSVVDLTDSLVSNNQSGQHGGGFYVENSTLNITRTDILENFSRGSGGGLMITGSSVFSAEESNVTNNIARDHGGGFYITDDSKATLTRTHVDGNLAGYESDGESRRESGTAGIGGVAIGDDLRGGGFRALGRARVTMTDSTLNENEASRYGGGFDAENEPLITLINTTVADNVANNHGGGARMASNAELVATNTTFSGNYSGFGRANHGGTATAEYDGRVGGGIWTQSSGNQATLNHVTITDNSVTSTSGGGIYRSDGLVSLENSIVFGNRGNAELTTTTVEDLRGSITLIGANVVGQHESGSLTGDTDLRIATDPGLQALADNGGFGRTHAILADSSAADSAINSTLATDQNGAGRIAAGTATSVTPSFTKKTGADLLGDSNFTLLNSDRTPTLNGTSLDFPAGEADSENLFEYQILAPGTALPSYPVTVVIDYDYTKTTTDQDFLFTLDGGATNLTWSMVDNDSTISYSGNTLISSGEPALGVPSSVRFEFTLTDSDSTLVATRSTGQTGSASSSTVINPFEGLTLRARLGNATERTQLDGLTVTVTPLTGHGGTADLGAFEVESVVETLALDEIAIPETVITGQGFEMSAGVTTTGGGPLTYQWEFVDSSGATVASSSGENPTFNLSNPASDPVRDLEVVLTVTDGTTGQTLIETKQVRVIDQLAMPTTGTGSAAVTTNADGGAGSLREAIALANASDDGTFVITFDAGIAPTLSLTGSDNDNSGGDLDITKTNGVVSFVGNGVSSTIIDGGTAADRVFDVRPGAMVSFSDLTITGGETGGDDHGGGLRILGADVIFKDVDITANAADRTSDNVGGAIYMTSSGLLSSHVLMTGGSVSGNQANSHGGGIYMAGNNVGESLLYLDGTVIDGNVASNASDRNDRDGGGMYITDDGNRIILKDVVVSDNQTNGTSGADGGGAFFTGADHTIEVTGGSWIRNQAGADAVAGGTDDADGGGFMVEGSRQSITFTDVKFGGELDASGQRVDGNIAEDDGGAFYMQGRHNTLNLVDVIIEGNQSNDTGGGFYIANDTEVVNITQTKVDGSKIINNYSATEHGGGFRNDGIVNITGSNGDAIDITGNQARVNGVRLVDDNPDALRDNGDKVGGGFYTSNNSTTNLTDVLISGNIAYTRGGGFFAAGGSTVTISSSSASTSGDSASFVSQIQDNHAIRKNSSNTTLEGDGGGFFVESASTSVTLSDVLITANSAVDLGGGFYLQSNFSKVDLTRVDITGNISEDSGGGFFVGSNGSLAELDTVLIDNNRSATEHGGGFYTAGSVTGRAVTITNNKVGFDLADAETSTGGLYGGGFYNTGGRVVLEDAIIENNVARQYGGGFMNRGGGTTEITSNLIRSSVSDNEITRSDSDGGGFWNAEVGKVSLTGVDVNDNVAFDEGGGFYNTSDGSRVELSDVIIDNNEAGDEGGGFRNASSFSVVTLDNTEITNNHTLRVNGGGFRNSGQVFGQDVIISNNTAGLDDQAANNDSNNVGGGFYSSGSSAIVDLERVEITDNDAHGRGGGFYNANGQVLLTNFVISRNTADQGTNEGQGRGGGVWNSSSGDIVLKQGEVSYNESFGHGAGINQQDTGSTTTLENVTISNNIAGIDQTGGGYVGERVGGGIWMQSSGRIDMDHVTITENQTTRNGTDSGSGFRADTGNVTMKNSIVFGNLRDVDGTPDADDIDNNIGTRLEMTGNNIIGQSTGTMTNTENAIISDDPNLGALEDNGGLLLPGGGAAKTHSLGAGSSAVDAASDSTSTFDQRGSLRVAADIGAYEVTSIVYVDDDWAGTADGTPVADGDLGTSDEQPAIFGVSAFATLADALAAVAADGTIIVNSGTYNEAIHLADGKKIEVTGTDLDGVVTIAELSSEAGTDIIIEGDSTLTVNNAGNLTIAGNISGNGGAGNFVKTGLGILSLSGVGSYTGTTTVSAGVLEIASDDAVDGTSGIQINGASTLQLRNVVLDRPIFANSSGVATLSGSAIHVVGGGASEINGAITLQRSISIKARVDANTSLEINGGVSGDFNLSLYDDSSGTPGITVSTNPINIGTNTLSGHGLILNVAGNTAGTLRADWGQQITLGVDNVFTTPPALVIANTSNASGQLDLNGHDLEVTGVTAAQASPNAIVTDKTGTATLTVTSSSPSTFTGVLAGGLQLVKAGPSDFTLSGNNTYSGSTTVNEGRLIVQHNNALGANTAGTVVTSTGQVLISGNGLTIAEPISIDGNNNTGSGNLGPLRNNGGDNTWSGEITLDGWSRISNNSGTFVVSGGVTSPPGDNYGFVVNNSSGIVRFEDNPIILDQGDIEFHSAGITELNVTGNIWDETRVRWSGRLQTNVANALPADTLVILGVSYNSGASSSPGQLLLNGYDQTIGGLTDLGTATRAVSSTSAATLTISNTVDYSFDGSITDDISLTKSGSAVQTLTGNNSYTGVTTVAVGTLALVGTGNIDQSSEIAVSGGAVFDVSGRNSGDYAFAGDLTGSGTVAGSITIGVNADLQPGENSGDDVGTLTITGDATITGNFDFDINGGSSDQLIVDGAVNAGVTLGGSITFDVTSDPTAAIITVINNDGTLDPTTGIFKDNLGADLVDGASVVLGSKTYRIFYNGGDGNDVVLVDASTPATIYVDDSFIQNDGQTVDDADLGDSGNQSAVYGVNAFNNLADALNAAGPDTNIILNGGDYGSETITLTDNQILEITGPNTVTAAQSTVTIGSVSTSADAEIIIEGNSILELSGGAADGVIEGVVTATTGKIQITGGTHHLLNTANSLADTADVQVDSGGEVIVGTMGANSGLGAAEVVLNDNGTMIFEDVSPAVVSPAVLSNMQAWYDASTLTLNDGDLVTAWADQSGNGRNLVSYTGTPTFADGELNGHPAVRFNGNNENLQMADPSNEYFAKDVYIVFRAGQDGDAANSNRSSFGPDWGAPIGVKDGDDNDRTWMFQGNEDRFWGSELPSGVRRNGVEISSANNFDMGGIDAGEYMILNVTAGAANGTQVREYIVGTRTDAWGNSRFDTAEIIAFDVELSNADRDLVEAYLTDKYIGNAATLTNDVTVSGSATIRINSGVGPTTLGDLTLAAGSTLNVEGETAEKALEFASTTLGGGDITVNAGNDAILTLPTITETAPTDLNFTGDGCFHLTTDNAYSGETVIGSGASVITYADYSLGGFDSDFTQVWQLGTNTNNYNSFSSNSNDEHYYFAGTYTTREDGNSDLAPTADEAANTFERELTNSDPSNFIHFNLPATDLTNDYRLELDFGSTWVPNGAIPYEVIVNGVTVFTGSHASDGDIRTVRFGGAAVSATTGDNVIEIRRTDTDLGGRIGLDNLRLLSSPNNTSNGGTTVENGGAMAVGGGTAIDEAITISGAGNAKFDAAIVKQGGGNTALNGPITLSGDARIHSANGNELDIRSGISMGGFSLTLDAENRLDLDSLLTGSGNLYIVGNDRVDFHALNSGFTGDVTVGEAGIGYAASTGRLDVHAGDGALGVGNTVTIANGSDAGIILRNSLDHSNDFVINGDGRGTEGAIRMESSTGVLSGNVSMSGDATIFTNNGALTIENAIAGGGFTLTKAGVNSISRLILNESNPTIGNVELDHGQIRILKSDGLGQTASLDIDSGEAIEFDFGGIGPVTYDGSTILNTFNVSDGSVEVISGEVTLGETFTLNLGLSGDINLGGDGALNINSDFGNGTGTVDADFLNHYGFRRDSGDALFDLNNNGGMLNSGSPTTHPTYTGEAFLNGPLNFANEAAFLASGVIDTSISGYADNYANVWVGYLNTTEIGAFQFQRVLQDDWTGIWIDIDQDGILESTAPGRGSNRGEQVAYNDGGVKTVNLTNPLGTGRYLVAFTHLEGGGESRAGFTYKLPSGSSLELINPGDAAQAGLWTAFEPIVIDNNVTKFGSGTTTFSGDNSYNGSTAVKAGTLVVTTDTALGTSDGGTTVNLGATLAFDGGASGITLAGENLSIGGTGATGQSGALVNLSGNNTLDGEITVFGADLKLSSETAGETLTVTGDVSLGFSTLTVDGVGDVILGGDISGDVDINYAANPSAIGGLQAWYDASTLSLNDGDQVTAWSDGSGYGRDLISYTGTPTFETNEINGLPAVRFNSSNENLQMANPSEYFAGDVYLVFRAGRDGDADTSQRTTFGPDWGAPFGVKDGDDADRMWMFQGNTDRFWSSELPASVTRNGVAVPSANNFDMGHLEPGGDIDASEYMVLQVAAGANNGTQLREYIVGTRTDAWGNSRFDTAEVLAFDHALSGEEKQFVEKYLADKYAIAGDFAATLPDLSLSNDVIKSGNGSLTLSGDNTYRGETTIEEGTVVAASNTALGSTDGGTTVLDGAVLALDNTLVDLVDNATADNSVNITIAGEAITLNGGGAGTGALVNVKGDNSIAATGSITAELVSLGRIGIGTEADTLTIDADIDLQSSRLEVNGAGDTVINGQISGFGVDVGGTPPENAGAATGVFTNVAEASDYIMVYESDGIPTGVNDNNPFPYSRDNSATVQSFDKIAYYMELDTGSGLEWVYVSMDAFTTDVGQIGVPTGASPWVYQQVVGNMNVYASAGAGVTTGTGIATGNIEIWPSNYGGSDGIGIPNATSEFDFGDSGASTSHGYGSFQIHNHDIDGTGPGTTGETLLAYNNWSSGTTSIGIGTNTGNGRPDYTFADNSGTYTVTRMAILVKELSPRLIETDNAVTKVGSGTLTLSAANTYNGVTTISEGVVKIDDVQALGSSTGTSDGTVVESGGALDLNGVNGAYLETITINGDGVPGDPDTGALFNSGASIGNDGPRNLILGSDASIGSDGGRFGLNSGTVTGSYTLTKVGNNDVWVGSNVQVADIVIDDGTYGIQGNNADNVSGSITINSAGTLSTWRSVTIDADLEFNGGRFSASAPSAGGENPVINGDIILTGANNRFNNSLNIAAITVNGDISGSGALVKIGSGLLTTTGANVYTGETSVTTGILLVNGSHTAGAGSYNVGGGAALGGVGTISTTGSVIVDGILATGDAATGDGIGELTVDADITINSQFQFEIVGANSDTLKVTVPTEEVTLGAGSVLVVTDATDPAAGSTILVIANGGSDAINGIFTDGVNPLGEGATVTSSDGNVYTISYAFDASGDGNGNDVVLFEGKAESHVDLAGGSLTISDINNDSVNNLRLEVVTIGGENYYQISDADPTRVFSTSGLANGEFIRPNAYTVQVKVSAVTGDITFDTTGPVAGLENNDRVTISGATPVPLSGNFSITADDVVIDAGAQLAVSGAGTVTIDAGQQIDMLAGSSITTDQGGITLNANSGGSAVGNATGIDLDGAGISSNGGDIILNGVASGTATIGVSLRGGTAISTTSGVVSISAESGDISVANATVSGEGNVSLAADDNFTLSASSSITSTNGRIDITVDQIGSADVGGSSVQLLGVVNARNDVFISGGDERDQFNINPNVFSVINIDGGSPTDVDAGDTLNTLNAINPQRTVIIDGFSGSFSFGGGQRDITYIDVERDNIPTLEINIPISQRLFPTTVYGTFTDFGLTENHILDVDWKDVGGGVSVFDVPSFNDGLAAGMVVGSSTDGAQLRIVSMDPVTGEVEFSVSHTYEQDGLYNIEVSVTDPVDARAAATQTAEVYFLAPRDGNAGFFSFASVPGRSTLSGFSGLFNDLRFERLFATDFEGDRLDLNALEQISEAGAFVSLESEVRVVVLAGTENQPGDFLTALNNSILNGTPLDLSGNAWSVESQEILRMISNLIQIDVDGAGD